MPNHRRRLVEGPSRCLSRPPISAVTSGFLGSDTGLRPMPIWDPYFAVNSGGSDFGHSPSVKRLPPNSWMYVPSFLFTGEILVASQ